MGDRPVLVIGNKNYSSWSMRPWLLLKQAGVAFDEVRISLNTPAFDETIGKWSPSARVPALRHGGISVWDSLAICEYASEALLDGRGWPRDREARAYARSISAEIHAGMFDLRGECPMNVRRILAQPLALGPGARRDVARVQAIWRDARARFGAGGEMLFGEFGVADAFYAPVVFRFRTYRVPLDAEAQRYSDAVLALPAVQAWLDEATKEPDTIAHYDTIGG